MILRTGSFTLARLHSYGVYLEPGLSAFSILEQSVSRSCDEVRVV